MIYLTKKQKIILSLVLIIIMMLLCKFNKSLNSQEIQNFNNNNNTPKIINFNTSWCYWSKKLQPVWDELTENMKNKNIQCIDLKCDLDENKETCEKYNVQGFPTIKLIVDNKVIDYEGDRSLDNLSKFIEKNTIN